MADPATMPNWRVAAVTGVDNGGAQIVLKSGVAGRIPLDELRWARRTLADQRLGPAVLRAQEVLSPGDIVLVEPLGSTALATRHVRPALPLYGLRQIPDVGGGFVAMDPKTGRDLRHRRRLGLSAEPIRPRGAGQAPAGLGDQAVCLRHRARKQLHAVERHRGRADRAATRARALPMWTPGNYEGSYVGQTTLRQALVHSRNLATARLATLIGLPAIAKTVEKFGIMDKMPLYYSMALGAGETTLLRLTTAYSMLDNGGH